MSMGKTKATYLIQDGIAYYEKIDLVNILQNTKFSLLIDESTDISVSQVLAIVVRFFDETAQDVRDAFFESVTVQDGSARGLYDAVKQLLAQHSIPITNIIGFGSDNCSTMLGKSGGFQALLKQDVPSVFVMPCLCNS